MRRVGAVLRPLWVRLSVVLVVVAVTATVGLALGKPSLFNAANSSAASSERGYHCHPHETGKDSCRPKHCC